MPAMAHAVLHLSLCQAMARAPVGAPIELRLHAEDATGRQRYDKSFTVERGSGDSVTVEYDSPRGVFKTAVVAPKFRCDAIDYLGFIQDRTRNIKEPLVDGMGSQPRNPTVMMGAAPESFMYAQPTFVLLDSKIQCGDPVDEPLQTDVRYENDADSFYLWLYPGQADYARGKETIALQMQSATSESRYIRLKFPYPQPWHGWPIVIQFDLSENNFDELASEKTNVLLCPKISSTSAG